MAQLLLFKQQPKNIRYELSTARCFVFTCRR